MNAFENAELIPDISEQSIETSREEYEDIGYEEAVTDMCAEEMTDDSGVELIYDDLSDPEEILDETLCDKNDLTDESDSEDDDIQEECYDDLSDSPEEGFQDVSIDAEEQTETVEEIPDEELSDEERAEIMKDFADQNVHPLVLPQKNGHWEGDEGDSKWIPDENAIVTWRKGGVTHEESYAEILERYGIDGIEYLNKEPDFSQVEDAVIGNIELDDFSDKRSGEGGTYAMASDAVAERLSGETGEVWTRQRVQEYMDEHGLTWHECSDRRTVRCIPTEINAAFKHTGGIGMQKSVGAAATVLGKQIGDGYSLERDLPFEGATVNTEELQQAIAAQREQFQRSKRA